MLSIRITINYQCFFRVENLNKYPDDMLLLPCENIQVIVDAIEKKIVDSDFTKLTDIVNLLPFLSQSFCRQIPYDAMSRN